MANNLGRYIVNRSYLAYNYNYTVIVGCRYMLEAPNSSWLAIACELATFLTLCASHPTHMVLAGLTQVYNLNQLYCSI